MKNTKKILLILSTLTLSFGLCAAPYLSVEGGVTRSEFNSNFFKNKHKKPTGRIALGLIGNSSDRIQLGVEAGVQAFGPQNNALNLGNSGHRRRTTVDALGVIDVYITPRFDLFAKAGFAYVHQSTSVETRGYKFSYLKKAVVPETIVGVGYNVSPNFNVNLSLANQFSRKDDTVENRAPNAASVMLGIKCTFA